MAGRLMGVSPADGRDGGDRITGCGDLRLPPPQYSCTVHCNQTHYGPVSSRQAASGVKGCQALVQTGRLGLGWDVDVS